MTAEEIKEFRKSKSLNQEQLGELCGVGKAAVSRWEKKLSAPSGSALIALKRLINGDDSIMPVTALDIKLLDENVANSDYKSREEYLTESLKFLLINKKFDTSNTPSKFWENGTQKNIEKFRIADTEEPYHAERESNIIDPSTEANDSGGNSNTSAS